MPYSLPTFNIPIKIWRWSHQPPAAPAVTTVGNLSWGRRVNLSGLAGGEVNVNRTITLLLPPLTDIRSYINVASGDGDLVEAPAATGRFYQVAFVDDIGKGFPNEHRAAILIQVEQGGSPWPAPMP